MLSAAGGTTEGLTVAPASFSLANVICDCTTSNTYADLALSQPGLTPCWRPASAATTRGGPPTSGPILIVGLSESYCWCCRYHCTPAWFRGGCWCSRHSRRSRSHGGVPNDGRKVALLRWEGRVVLCQVLLMMSERRTDTGNESW